jgi:hypothetical protein
METSGATSLVANMSKNYQETLFCRYGKIVDAGPVLSYIA